MTQDEHTSRCSNSSSGGDGLRSSKKLKHKKVPQRGMGVAQLEKIILEEQQKTPNPILLPTNSSSCLGPNFRRSAAIPNILQRSQSCSSSMVNVSVGTSSLSVMNFQIEPPSNQSCYVNNKSPPWPEEEEIVGMKRSYSFSIENVPVSSFHCKFPSAYISPIPRSDESASCSNGGTTSLLGPANPVFRETSSCSASVSDAITKKFIDETRGLTRDFLKLAPPQEPHSHSGEQLQFETTPLEGQKDPIHLFGRGGSKSNQPFLSFFPAAKTPMGLAKNINGEASESVDLTLKL